MDHHIIALLLDGNDDYSRLRRHYPYQPHFPLLHDFLGSLRCLRRRRGAHSVPMFPTDPMNFVRCLAMLRNNRSISFQTLFDF
jgi:hypothetical protein